MIKTAISLFIIWILLLLTPGPDFVLILRNTINKGLKEGILTNIGISLGLTIHTTAAILGIVVLSENPTLFNTVKIIGAIYLIYIGTSGFLNMKKSTLNLEAKDSKSSNSIREGFFCNILNPKLPLILLGVFTQLIPLNTPLWIKFLYGLEIIVASFLMWNLVALLFGNRKVLPQLKRFQKEIVILANTVLVFLGSYEILTFLQRR